MASDPGYTFLKIARISPLICLMLLQPCLKVIDSPDREIRLPEGRIWEALVCKIKELLILSSIPGIGFTSASILIAEIGNINDFENADRLTKRAALTPPVFRSANVTRTVRFTKHGSRHVRWILVEPAPLPFGLKVKSNLSSKG
jgi:transposase